eukprot:scaffold5598_cov158-Ochromonas_danica.AAC.1
MGLAKHLRSHHPADYDLILKRLFTMIGISHLPDNIWLAYVLDPYYKGHMMGDEVKGSIVEKLRAMVAAVK